MCVYMCVLAYAYMCICMHGGKRASNRNNDGKVPTKGLKPTIYITLYNRSYIFISCLRSNCAKLCTTGYVLGDKKW